nr:MAG TPA: hypothetical protein [Caudoviricetes sp.]
MESTHSSHQSSPNLGSITESHDVVLARPCEDNRSSRK